MSLKARPPANGAQPPPALGAVLGFAPGERVLHHVGHQFHCAWGLSGQRQEHRQPQDDVVGQELLGELGGTVGETLTNNVATIGENMRIRRAAKLSAHSSTCSIATRPYERQNTLESVNAVTSSKYRLCAWK